MINGQWFKVRNYYTNDNHEFSDMIEEWFFAECTELGRAGMKIAGPMRNLQCVMYEE